MDEQALNEKHPGRTVYREGRGVSKTPPQSTDSQWSNSIYDQLQRIAQNASTQRRTVDSAFFAAETFQSMLDDDGGKVMIKDRWTICSSLSSTAFCRKINLHLREL